MEICNRKHIPLCRSYTSADQGQRRNFYIFWGASEALPCENEIDNYRAGEHNFKARQGKDCF